MNAIVRTEQERLQARIREIDSKLEALRPRLASLREQIARLTEKENRHIRLFAEADHREKKKIDAALVEVVEQRAVLKRECKGIAISMAELEANRAELYPEFQRLSEAEHRDERKRQIEALRQQHEKDQIAEQEADRKLMEAREKSNRSFFAWRSALDQEIVAEQSAALDRQKEQWARISGPNARNQPHMN